MSKYSLTILEKRKHTLQIQRFNVTDMHISRHQTGPLVGLKSNGVAAKAQPESGDQFFGDLLRRILGTILEGVGYASWVIGCSTCRHCRTCRQAQESKIGGPHFCLPSRNRPAVPHSTRRIGLQAALELRGTWYSVPVHCKEQVQSISIYQFISLERSLQYP